MFDSPDLHNISDTMRYLQGETDAPRVEEAQFKCEAAIDIGDIHALYEVAHVLRGAPVHVISAIEAKAKEKFGAEFRTNYFLRAIRGQRSGTWKDSLLTNDRGAPTSVVNNAMTALRSAPEWDGVLVYDEFRADAFITKPTPWGKQIGAWEDHDTTETAAWLQRNGISASVQTAWYAVQAVSRDNPVHPVREYLQKLQWDGTPRLETWLQVYLGATMPNASDADEDADLYLSAVGLRWMVSAVARVLKPGCKADCCLILEGPQGKGKSTALEVLGTPWFTDEIADLGSKDAAMQVRGVWIIEISELDSMTRSDVSRVKAFMSRTTDRFRPAYGRQVIAAPRQCVFAGSTNSAMYFRDETGGRRFWPIACGNIKIADLRRDKDQLWAEAVVKHAAGTPWWLDTADLVRRAEEEQAQRYVGDPWQEIIEPWLARPTQRRDNTGYPVDELTSDADSVTIRDIMIHALERKKDQWTQLDKNRVVTCLRAAGWERYRERRGAGLEWRYRRKR
jgi:predicted P-loop ATPase